MKSVRYRRAARVDLDRIADEGEARWGREAAEAYVRAINRSLQSLLEFAGMGSDRSHARPHLRKWTVEAHHAYYQVDDAGIDVIRILHPSADALKAFSGDSGPQ